MGGVYSFSYYDGEIPSRFSLAKDHWGYYNGADDNENLLPHYYYGTYKTGLGSNRDPSWPEMRNGSLKKITYPTGGFSEFEYESHSVIADKSNISDAPPILSGSFFAPIGFNEGNGYTEIPFTVTTADDYRLEMVWSWLESSEVYDVQLIIEDENDNYVFSTTMQNSMGHSTSALVTLAEGDYTIRRHDPSGPYNGILSASIASSGIVINVQQDVEQMVGGLRIHKIISDDDLDKSSQLVKTYDYGQEFTNQSSGVLYQYPSYYEIIRNEEFEKYGRFLVSFSSTICGSGGDESEHPYYQVSKTGCYNFFNVDDSNGALGFFNFLIYNNPMGLNPYQLKEGGHIGYTRVKETLSNGSYSVKNFNAGNLTDYGYQPDGSLFNIAKIHVQEYNCDGVSGDLPMSFPPAPVQYDYERGTLSSEELFNSSGARIERKEYIRSYVDNLIVNETPGVIISSSFPTPGSYGNIYTFYKIKNKVLVEEAVTTEKFNNAGTATFSYSATKVYDNNHPFLLREEIRNQPNAEFSEKAQYNYPINLIFQDYLYDQDQEAFSEYLLYLQNSEASTTAFFDEEGFSFGSGDNCISDADADLLGITLDQKYTSDLALRRTYINGLKERTQRIQNQIEGNRTGEAGELEEMVAVNRVNLVSEVVRSRNNAIVGSTYNEFFDLNPRSYKESNLEEPSTLFSSVLLNPSGGVETDPSYTTRATYVFNEIGNVVGIEDENGIPTTYIWGYNQSLIVAKIENVSISEIEGLGLNDLINDGDLTQIDMVSSTFPNATITTYDYIPGVGISTITDSNGRTSNYTYDDLGRLIEIRDSENNIIKQYEYNIRTD